MSRNRKNRGRNISGLLLLDKPAGASSNKVLQQAKFLFKANKAGHTGSLDPLATGLLPICFGEATKLSGYLLNADKRYFAVCQLGITTTTGDAEGEIIHSADVPALTLEHVDQVCGQFIGEIMQTPPMYSALKINGVPLYKLAREGVEVEREARQVTIYAIKVLALEGDKLVLDVRCSKGTYIRTLAEQIGEQLNCGAHITELRRTEVAGFTLENAYTLEQLEAKVRESFQALDDYLMPLESVLTDWPDVTLSADMAFYMRQGQPVLVPRAPTSGLVRLIEGPSQQFFGIGQILDDGRVAPKRLLNLSS